jgi:hypothetical protein
MVLTVAWVPTGMNMGVFISPCGVVTHPSRALLPLSFFNSLNPRAIVGGFYIPGLRLSTQ